MSEAIPWSVSRAFYNPMSRSYVVDVEVVRELEHQLATKQQIINKLLDEGSDVAVRAQLAAERARNAELVKGIKSILPKPPYHPTLEPEWVYLSGLIENKQNTP